MSEALNIFEIAETSLTPRIQGKMFNFVRAYDGDLIYALRVAGYQGTDKYLEVKGQELLARPDIQQALRHRKSLHEKREGALLSKVDKMEFLAAVVRNSDPYERPVIDDYGQEVPPPPPSINERLKALDMYNKMEGEYHTNINVNHNLSMSDLILSSFVDNHRKLEDIEADYIEMQSGESVPEDNSEADLLGL